MRFRVEGSDHESVVPQIHTFYQRWFSRKVGLFIVGQTILAGIVALLLNYFWTIISPPVAISASAAILLVVEIIFGLIFAKTALDPLDQILRVLANDNGETTSTPPPDINSEKFTRSKLNYILEKIHDKSSLPVQRQPSMDMASVDMSREVLAKLPVGFIALDKNNSIALNNKLAPVETDNDGQKYIELDFSGMGNSETIASWLEKTEQDKIYAEKFWPRIQDRAPGKDGRRVFDVLASFSRNEHAVVQTLIITIDRTADYADDEQSMDFVSMVGHELRGPITIIRGYLEILGEEFGGKLTPQQQQMLDRLNASAKTLSSYIGNILNANRAERGDMHLKLEESSVGGLIADVHDDEDLSARVAGHDITWEIPHNLPTVVADHSAVSEVMTNLIGNAIKYSPSGAPIEVSAEKQDDFVAISVKDHGIGMPDNVMENLFSKFYRSHRSKASVAGNGIGLYISQIMVEACGGHIGVRSIEGVGSTFTFTLPIYATWDGNITSRVDSEPAIENHGYIER